MTDEDKACSEEEKQDLERVREGDVEAYNRLVERYQGKIYAIAYNMTGNNEDAKDLVQDIFVKAFRNLKRFKGDSSFYTWIYRIAVNHTINFLKKRNRQHFYSLDDVDQGVENDPDYVDLVSNSEPFRNAELSELQKKLNEAIQKLSEKHRAVVIMHDIEGLPHEEISKILGCSEGTVRSRLFYARRQLQNFLQEYQP